MQVETIDEDAAESNPFTAFVVIVTVVTIIYPSSSFVSEQGKVVSEIGKAIKQHAFKLGQSVRKYQHKRKQASGKGGGSDSENGCHTEQATADLENGQHTKQSNEHPPTTAPLPRSDFAYDGTTTHKPSTNPGAVHPVDCDEQIIM